MQKYALLLTGMIIAFFGQILLKTGIESSTLTPNLSSIIKTLLSPRVFSGFALYGVASIIWLFVLQRLPLSIAAPSLSLTYIFIFLYSLVVLGEKAIPFNYLGLVFIMLGVVLISLK